MRPEQIETALRARLQGRWLLDHPFYRRWTAGEASVDELRGDALAFWDVHASLDTEHAAWALEALAGSDADMATVVDAAGTAADAWWGFLDERDVLRA